MRAIKAIFLYGTVISIFGCNSKYSDKSVEAKLPPQAENLLTPTNSQNELRLQTATGDYSAQETAALRSWLDKISGELRPFAKPEVLSVDVVIRSSAKTLESIYDVLGGNIPFGFPKSQIANAEWEHPRTVLMHEFGHRVLTERHLNSGDPIATELKKYFSLRKEITRLNQAVVDANNGIDPKEDNILDKLDEANARLQGESWYGVLASLSEIYADIFNLLVSKNYRANVWESASAVNKDLQKMSRDFTVAPTQANVDLWKKNLTPTNTYGSNRHFAFAFARWSVGTQGLKGLPQWSVQKRVEALRKVDAIFDNYTRAMIEQHLKWDAARKDPYDFAGQVNYIEWNESLAKDLNAALN